MQQRLRAGCGPAVSLQALLLVSKLHTNEISSFRAFLSARAAESGGRGQNQVRGHPATYPLLIASALASLASGSRLRREQGGEWGWPTYGTYRSTCRGQCHQQARVPHRYTSAAAFALGSGTPFPVPLAAPMTAHPSLSDAGPLYPGLSPFT